MADFKHMDMQGWLASVWSDYLWEHGMLSNGTNGIWLWYVWLDEATFGCEIFEC